MESIIPFLETKHLVLEKLTLKHCKEYYLNWLHDSEVNFYLETGHFPLDLSQLENFIQGISKEEIFLAIYTKNNSKHIGNIRLYAINPRHGTAEFGILIGDKSSWGKGYAKEASAIIFDHAFNRLNVRKIKIGIVSGNKGSIRVYEKLGFIREGQLKEHFYINGDYIDIEIMSLFRRDWLNNGQ